MKLSTTQSIRTGALLVLILSTPTFAQVGPMSGASQAKPSATKAPALPPPSVEWVPPVHLRNQAERLLAFEECNLDLPPDAEIPFTLELPLDGARRTLELRKHSVRSSSFQLLAQVEDGSFEERSAGAVRTFRGEILGLKGSVVAGSVLQSGLEARIVLPDGREFAIEPQYAAAMTGDQRAHVVFPIEAQDLPEVRCHVDESMRVQSGGQSDPFLGSGCATGTYCTAELALDLDYRFFEDMGSNAPLTTSVAEMIVNVANLQYERDVAIRHLLTTVLVRSSLASEPAAYEASNGTGELLGAFKTEWLANHGSVQRDVAHLMSGRHNGGTAYLGVICNTSWHYGVSTVTGAVTTFTRATQLVAHELGHNWDADHCSTCTDWTMYPYFPPQPLRFHATETIPEIIAHKNSRSCLEGLNANDDIEHAIELCGTGGFSSNTYDATSDGSSSCDVNPGIPDVWFVFRPTSNGTLSVDTCQGSTNFDTLLSVHSGIPGTSANQIDCDDDSCGVGSSISIPVYAGESYYVRVSGYSSSGNFTLLYSAPTCATPLNDLPETAMVIGPGRYYGQTYSAGATPVGPFCSPDTADVWYRYKPAFSDILVVETCGSTWFDTVLELHERLPDGTPQYITCIDDSCGTKSRIDVSVNAGTEYLIRVTGYQGASGPFELHVAGPDNSNDRCSGATLVDEGTTLAHTQGAYSIDGESTCGPEGRDVWFRYTAPGPGTLTVDTCGTHHFQGDDAGMDSVLSLHSGCPGTSANTLDCNDDDLSCYLDSKVSTTVAADQTVYIRVRKFNPSTDSKPFLLNVDFVHMPPPNDECLFATPVSSGTTMGTLDGATNSGLGGCFSTTTADVWYFVTAACDGDLILSTCGSNDLPGTDQGLDTVLSVFDSCGGTLLYCFDDAAGACGGLDQGLDRDSYGVIPNVTAGTSFLVRVSDYNLSDAGDFLFNVDCTPVDNDGDPYCFGDGSGAFCPCFAYGNTGQGCRNTSGTHGASMNASGHAGFSNETLRFTITGVPGAKPGILIKGSSVIATRVGDGLLCTNPQARSQPIMTNASGTVTINNWKTLDFNSIANPPGTATKFQYWYRDPANACSGAGFNFTNGWTVTFVP